MKFKVGDKVTIKYNTECIGEVREMCDGYSAPIRVRWEDGENMFYTENNLDFAEISAERQMEIAREALDEALAEIKSEQVEEKVTIPKDSWGENIEDMIDATKYVVDAYVRREDDFIKFDNDKPRTDLLHPEFILEMSEILSFGAKKYAADNWKKCENYDQYYAAAMRHLLQWKTGEILDDESDKNHLIHTAVNIMFLYYLSTQKES